MLSVNTISVTIRIRCTSNFNRLDTYSHLGRWYRKESFQLEQHSWSTHWKMLICQRLVRQPLIRWPQKVSLFCLFLTLIEVNLFKCRRLTMPTRKLVPTRPINGFFSGSSTFFGGISINRQVEFSTEYWCSFIYEPMEFCHNLNGEGQQCFFHGIRIKLVFIQRNGTFSSKVSRNLLDFRKF